MHCSRPGSTLVHELDSHQQACEHVIEVSEVYAKAAGLSAGEVLQRIQGLLIEISAREHYGVDISRAANIFKWIAAKQNQVGLLADFDTAEGTIEPGKPGRVDGGGLDGLQWREPCVDQHRQLIVQAGAAKYIGIDVVGASHKLDSGGLSELHLLTYTRKEVSMYKLTRRVMTL